jgi:putative membrane protein
MMYWNGGMGLWGYLLMSLSFVMFWAAVITVLVLLFRSMRTAPPNQGPAPDTNPEMLLAARFARGEIDETEYMARLAALPPQRQHPAVTIQRSIRP